MLVNRQNTLQMARSLSRDALHNKKNGTPIKKGVLKQRQENNATVEEKTDTNKIVLKSGIRQPFSSHNLVRVQEQGSNPKDRISAIKKRHRISAKDIVTEDQLEEL